VYTQIIEKILTQIDGYAEEVERYGADETYVKYEGLYDSVSADEVVYPSRWERKIWGCPGTDEEVLMEIRKLKEGYRQVREERDILERLREPKDAEKSGEERVRGRRRSYD
jgi:hypothetical protein